MITVIGNGFVGANVAKTLKTTFPVTMLSRPMFDLNCVDSFESIPKDTKVLIHAAGTIDVGEDKIKFWRTNVESTLNLVDFLNSHRSVSRLLYCSSGAVYGQRKKPSTIFSKPNPDSLYALSRFTSEQIIRTQFSGESIILRLYFPFGPGQSKNRFIPRLVESIKQKTPIYVAGTKGAYTNPIYIDDLSESIRKIVELASPKPIYNIGGREVISVSEIAKIIANEMNAGQPNIISKPELSISDVSCRPDFLVEKNHTFRDRISLLTKESNENQEI